ncbi:MAG: Gfo/Idh/MocA family oxidoreductase [Candidatus Omnitrophota bacterium]
MVNVGLIGYGYWGPNLARNVYGDFDCELKWVCDVSASHLKLCKKRYPHVEVTRDYTRLLKDKTLDAVVISTPFLTHYEIAKKALLAGKHVLIEKPFVHSIKMGEELINIAKKNKLVLMIGFTFLYSPPVLKIKKLISDKELGPIMYINSTRVHFGHLKQKESVVGDLASHDLSIILFWLKFKKCLVSCSGSDGFKRGAPDTAYIELKMPNGAGVYIFVSWLAPIRMRNMLITGKKKMVFFNDTRNTEKIKIYDQSAHIANPTSFGEYQLTYRKGDINSPYLDADEPLAKEISDFATSIKQSKSPRSDGQLGLKVIKLLEGAQLSLKKQKTVSVEL